MSVARVFAVCNGAVCCTAFEMVTPELLEAAESSEESDSGSSSESERMFVFSILIIRGPCVYFTTSGTKPRSTCH